MARPATVLIRNAEVWDGGAGDVRIKDGAIAAVGQLVSEPGETVIDAAGSLLLPGLHDHHIHLAGLAARGMSVKCGPPDVTTPAALAERLSAPGSGWLRGIGYHESVMGLPDALELDRMLASRPLRIQHRSGRMWLLNSLALEQLLARRKPPPGLERVAGQFTGRLFDEDQWLQAALGSSPPVLAAVSAELAGYGVTGVTDMSPRNDPAMAAHFTAQIAGGSLRQRLMLAGSLALAQAEAGPWQLGPAKLHLHEADLPDFAEAAAFIAAAHRQNRAVAIHCTSEVEIVFALAALEEAGPHPGDRIEHASIADAGHIARIAAHGISVCVQPHFVADRGDRYLRDVEHRLHAHLYPLASLQAAGVALSGGSDAPFVSADPWHAMRAAVSRQTHDGAVVGSQEALSPETALRLYLADPADFAKQRRIVPGAPADLVLLDRAWVSARERLASTDVRAVWIAGQRIDNSVDESPSERMPG